MSPGLPAIPYRARVRFPSVLAGLALVVGVAACGDDPEVGTAPTPPAEVRPTASTHADVVGPPTLDQVGLEDPTDCQPWGPVHAVAGTYGGQPTVVGVAPPEEGSIDVLARRFDAPDTDGDGVPDAVANQGVEVSVARADGTATLAREGAAVGSPGGQTWIGDLDGDGRDEILVFASDPLRPGALEVYVVPGTVGPGRHEPADVGVLLPWPPNSFTWSVGDHDGDGADDVVVPSGSGPIVVSGRELLAPGPGGRLDDQLTPLRDAPPELVGVLELAPDVPPVFVTATDTGGAPESRIELRVLTDPPLRLRIGGLDAIGGGWGPSGVASGYVSGGDRIVAYRFSGGRSGYGGEWRWNLDMPCPAPMAPPATRRAGNDGS